MANVKWTMRLYDRNGAQITAADMTPSATVSNEIKHATERQIEMPLNGIDTLGFTLFLDDPMAYQIKRLSTYVKVWRTIYDYGTTPIWADPADTPCFGGVVSYTNKDGDQGTMQVTCQSPFWRLQLRFHILNHYLNINVDTSQQYTQSELMWKLIDLVNNAFGLGISNTGIAKGTFSSGNDPIVAPYFVAKGTNTYNHIFEVIMNRPGGPDIVPVYTHVDNDPTVMYFNTDEKRGTNGAFALNYRTGTNDNLDNCTEEEPVIPGEFGNYLWAVGAGGPNSGKIALEENVNEDDDSYESIGIYMVRKDFPEIKKIGLAGPPPTHLKAVADAEFAQARVPKTNHTCTISPAGNLYYGKDFNLGDTGSLVATKGALNVNKTGQRIYDVKLTISDNNVEIADISIADDFTGKVTGE